jgi:hypothetical protein
MLKKIKNVPQLQQFKNDHPIINAIVILLAVVMLWRGIWGILDTYFFPGSPLFSYLVSIGLGALVLYLDDFKIDNLRR